MTLFVSLLHPLASFMWLLLVIERGGTHMEMKTKVKFEIKVGMDRII